MHWREAIEDELPGNQLAGETAGSNSKEAYANMVLWQLEGKPYGLIHLREVKKDKILYAFCQELAALYHREIRGEEVEPDEFNSLNRRVLEIWTTVSEKKRKETVEFARKWALLGARKWAWIPSRAWTRTWNWLIAGTRPKSYSSVVLLISSWSGAWKWGRFWESPTIRIKALENQLNKLQ